MTRSIIVPITTLVEITSVLWTVTHLTIGSWLSIYTDKMEIRSLDASTFFGYRTPSNFQEFVMEDLVARRRSKFQR